MENQFSILKGEVNDVQEQKSAKISILKGKGKTNACLL